MNRMLILLIRLLLKEKAETEPDENKKNSLYKKIMKKREEQTK